MAWEDDVEPDFVHELPFWLVAAMAHGALLTLDPILRWGAAPRADEKVIPVEFVAQLPIVEPTLAPAAGDGRGDTPRRGPGAYEPPKLKQGARDAPPKAKPVPKPAAVKAPAKKPGASARTQAAKAVKVPALDPAAERRRESQRILAAAAARRKAEAAEAAREAAAERSRERAQAAAAARAEAAERARLKAEERAAAAERARLERVRAAAEKEERRRAEAERQAALAAERRRVLAEQKAAKAARRAELSSALATMDDPDEALDAGAAAPSGGRRAGQPMRGPSRSGAGRAAAATALQGLDGDGGAAGGASGPGSDLRGAARAGAAAALAESPDPGDAAGSGGGDLIDAPARGGGEGPEGGGVSWTVDGSIGSRRMLRRVSPTSPDWVGTRGLDLTVTVRFQVLPDGRVRPGAVQKTSGFPEIDARALDALRRWRFEAAPSAKGEVWGRVTFRFTS